MAPGGGTHYRAERAAGELNGESALSRQQREPCRFRESAPCRKSAPPLSRGPQEAVSAIARVNVVSRDRPL